MGILNTLVATSNAATNTDPINTSFRPDNKDNLMLFNTVLFMLSPSLKYNTTYRLLYILESRLYVINVM